MTDNAKRFAIVRSLALKKPGVLSNLLAKLRSYPYQIGAKLLAGISLWLILICHASFAAVLAHAAFYRREAMLINADRIALKVMKDLSAAIAFARQDSVNDYIKVDPERRVAALRREAVRLGIA